MYTNLLKCASPVIICNRSLKRSLPYCVHIHTPYFDNDLYPCYRYCSHSFYRYIVKFKQDVTYDNINDFYLVTDDGEILPLFILVPCNKCFICRDKLSQMWQFRGIAESRYSDNHTYFVTLTFNNDFLPYKGVDKRHIQLFMKRLRRNLDRLGIEHNIKYFACGEYGKNTKRPHYHLVLWHFPDKHPYFSNLSKILSFIESCWCVYYQKELISLGFSMCKRCDSGSFKYVMKYVRKSVPPPAGKNPMFYCCSKGIGYQYFLDNYEFLSNNPQLLSLSINDPVSGEVFTSPYPTYYKSKLMPSFCKFFPKEVVDSFQKLLFLHNQIYTISQLLTFDNFERAEFINKFYPIYYGRDFVDTINDYYFHRFSVLDEVHLLRRYENLCSDYVVLDKILCSYLRRFSDPIYSLFYQRSFCLQLERSKYLSIHEFPKYSLESLRIMNDKIERDFNRKLQKEVL